MKITVELADDLAREATRYAARYGLTLRAVIEEAIRSMVRRETETRTSFALRDAGVDGSGLQPEFRDEAWSRLRDAAYGAERETATSGMVRVPGRRRG